ncbi:hypothetical protein E2C01_073957 [Portunus trituberculatus]|uniref:Uncharacterized protein n=1 Tax=Portunus trituberculatus TaxID=210409 RepID=A0A5B7IC19_PORTR|nr:hypothetical protein [Portunus trituberculatus]
MFVFQLKKVVSLGETLSRALSPHLSGLLLPRQLSASIHWLLKYHQEAAAHHHRLHLDRIRPDHPTQVPLSLLHHPPAALCGLLPRRVIR